MPGETLPRGSGVEPAEVAARRVELAGIDVLGMLKTLKSFGSAVETQRI